ncbi:hypothetical protein COLO4_36914 [Corchorus olitorius]|uniref:Uncharacterized protein n=1 Tax=Corchorus olitorius TaxID=93759 RepID=A0A1R3G4D7_9ROSI|nr:hypothetical protein COLO4_36914 [Corchorus olitorius]
MEEVKKMRMWRSELADELAKVTISLCCPTKTVLSSFEVISTL